MKINNLTIKNITKPHFKCPICGGGLCITTGHYSECLGCSVMFTNPEKFNFNNWKINKDENKPHTNK